MQYSIISILLLILAVNLTGQVYINSYVFATGGGDVTPNAVDFGGYIESGNPVQSNQVTFTGINTNITIRISVNFNDGYDQFFYIKNSTEVEVSSFPVDITISNNDTLKLSAVMSNPSYGIGLEIINLSDNNSILDNDLILYRAGGG